MSTNTETAVAPSVTINDDKYLISDLDDKSKSLLNDLTRTVMEYKELLRSYNQTLTLTNTGSTGGQYITDGQTNRYISSALSQGATTTHMSLSFNITGDLSDYRGAYLFGTENTQYQTTYKINAEL